MIGQKHVAQTYLKNDLDIKFSTSNRTPISEGFFYRQAEIKFDYKFNLKN